MPMRTCAKCGAAENPLGRLSFKKSLVDRKVYCEKCDPTSTASGPEVSGLVVDVSPAAVTRPSAGSMVVIQCPSCRSVPRGPTPASCTTCSDYGSVRIPVNHLNVYRPETKQ